MATSGLSALSCSELAIRGSLRNVGMPTNAGSAGILSKTTEHLDETGPAQEPPLP
jgi:hypothetical protein